MGRTKKMAERVSGVTIACATAFRPLDSPSAGFGSGAIGCDPLGAGGISFFEIIGPPRMRTIRPQDYHCFPVFVQADYAGPRQTSTRDATSKWCEYSGCQFPV